MSSSSIISYVISSLVGLQSDINLKPCSVALTSLLTGDCQHSKIVSLSFIFKEILFDDDLDVDLVYGVASKCISLMRFQLVSQLNVSKSLFRIESGLQQKDIIETLQFFLAIMAELWNIQNSTSLPATFIGQLELIEEINMLHLDPKGRCLLKTLRIYRALISGNSFSVLKNGEGQSQHMWFPLCRAVAQCIQSLGASCDLTSEFQFSALYDKKLVDVCCTVLLILMDAMKSTLLDFFAPQVILSLNNDDSCTLTILTVLSYSLDEQGILAMEACGLSAIIANICTHDTFINDFQANSILLVKLLYQIHTISEDIGLIVTKTAIGNLAEKIFGDNSLVHERHAASKVFNYVVDHLHLSMFAVYGDCFAVALRGLGNIDKEIRRTCATSLRTLALKAGVGKSFMQSANSEDIVLKILKGNEILNVKDDKKCKEILEKSSNLVMSFLYRIFCDECISSVNSACVTISGKELRG